MIPGPLPWVGVDLDGTLAKEMTWETVEDIGEPIMPMVEKVKEMLAEGVDVRIYTARVAHGGEEARAPIRRYCQKHIGKVLPITCQKDFGMVACYDDRSIQMIPNTGKRSDGKDL